MMTVSGSPAGSVCRNTSGFKTGLKKDYCVKQKIKATDSQTKTHKEDGVLNIPAVLAVLSDAHRKHYVGRTGVAPLRQWKDEWAELSAATLGGIWWLSLNCSGNYRKCSTSLHTSDTSTAGFPTTVPLKREATSSEGIIYRSRISAFYVQPTADDNLYKFRRHPFDRFCRVKTTHST